MTDREENPSPATIQSTPLNPMPFQPPLEYSQIRRGMSSQAVIAMILGLSAIPLDIVMCSGIFFGFVAIFVGIGALDAIKTNPQLHGKPLAIIGILAGIAAICLPLAAFLLAPSVGD
jgi:hypothetical protein